MRPVTLRLTLLVTLAAASVPVAVASAATQGQWVAAGHLDVAREDATATVLADGTVLVVGGCTNSVCSQQTTAVELYDPVTGGWSSCGPETAHLGCPAPLGQPRARHTATLLDDGTVLVAGGHSSVVLTVDQDMASAELYDPATGRWSSCGLGAGAAGCPAPLDEPRSHHTASLLDDGTVLVAGGGPTGGSTEVYDPATGSWSSCTAVTASPGCPGPLHTPRSEHTATRLADGAVLVGGSGHPGSDPTAAEIYDPTTGLWQRTGSMAIGRHEHTAAILPVHPPGRCGPGCGRVLVVGGRGGTAAGSTSELFDPDTGTWTRAGDLADDRNDHTAAVLEDGTVLVVGGGSQQARRSAERYDPATGTWQSAAPPLAGRSSHTSSLLHDGSVLVTGGAGFFGTDSRLAEVFTPTRGRAMR